MALRPAYESRRLRKGQIAERSPDDGDPRDLDLS